MFELVYCDAKKDFLAFVRNTRAFGRPADAVLVGGGGDDPVASSQLVDCLPERMVHLVAHATEVVTQVARFPLKPFETGSARQRPPRRGPMLRRR